MELFKIGNKDFTRYIKVPSYVINNVDVYTEWTDANRKTHRDVSRQKMQGTFSLLFSTESEYYNFIDTIKQYKDKGGGFVAPVSLYANNENKLLTDLEVFIDAEYADYLPVISFSENEGIDISIEER